MNKKTRLVLVAVLLVALVATLLAACTLDDSTTTTDADKLYAAYSVAVSAKGYKPVSKTEFEEIPTAATKDGGTITSKRHPRNGKRHGKMDTDICAWRRHHQDCRTRRKQSRQPRSGSQSYA